MHSLRNCLVALIRFFTTNQRGAQIILAIYIHYLVYTLFDISSLGRRNRWVAWMYDDFVTITIYDPTHLHVNTITTISISLTHTWYRGALFAKHSEFPRPAGAWIGPDSLSGFTHDDACVRRHHFARGRESNAKWYIYVHLLLIFWIHLPDRKRVPFIRRSELRNQRVLRQPAAATRNFHLRCFPSLVSSLRFSFFSQTHPEKKLMRPFTTKQTLSGFSLTIFLFFSHYPPFWK